MDALAHSVLAPLPQWAHTRADAPALRDGLSGAVVHTFASLWQAVQDRTDALAQAPHTVLVRSDQSVQEELVDFLAVLATGRCAAVACADWTAATHAQVRDQLATLPAHSSYAQGCEQEHGWWQRPFYIGYTSGSTGVPKGFRRSHGSWVESLRICADTFGLGAQDAILAPGSMGHSLFLFGMLLGLWTGAGVVVQDRFSAAKALAQLAAGHATTLLVVPSQLLMMVELATRRRLPPMPGVRCILISGARWARQHTETVRALFPLARVVEFYGASETSFIAWQEADPAIDPQVVGRPFANVDLRINTATGAASATAANAGEAGLIFVRSPMLFMDYVMGAADHTACVRDGDWLSVRDMGYLDAQGRLCLLGREQRMLVTQGKNLFAEELETVLCQYPGVQHASVHGVADALRGQTVVAVLHCLAQPLDLAELRLWCQQRLEAYKVPRRFLQRTDWPLTASGKTDHQQLALWVQSATTDQESQA